MKESSSNLFSVKSKEKKNMKNGNGVPNLTSAFDVNCLRLCLWFRTKATEGTEKFPKISHLKAHLFHMNANEYFKTSVGHPKLYVCEFDLITMLFSCLFVVRFLFSLL